MATTYTRTCEVDACSEKHEAFGFCPKHYSKFRRYGAVYGPFKPRNLPTMCIVENCNKRGPIYGLCHKHSNWKKRTGDPTVRPPKAEYFKRSSKNKQSRYKYVTVNNHPILGTGSMTEHRVVMTEFLGRKLLTSENIHHINGDGKDNRIENLELWTTFQPPGQRIEDKVSYAIEILKQYKPEILKEGI